MFKHLIRFLVAAITLLLIGYIVPGFQVFSFSSAFLAALVIASLGWIAETFFGEGISPYGRGVVGFLTTAVIIYITQFIVGGMKSTFIGALLASLIIGIVDLFIPLEARFQSKEEKN